MEEARRQANRAFNLTVTTVLFLAGIAFGGVLFSESEGADQIDDFGLLVVGLVAVAWYFVGRHRFARSLAPVALTIVSAAVQLVGVVLERDDREAFGDNIGGTILMVAFVVFVLYQWFRPQRVT